MRSLFFVILFLIVPFLIMAALAPRPANTQDAAAPAIAISPSPTPTTNVMLKFTIIRNEKVTTHSEVQVELNHTATLVQQEVKNPYHYKIEVTPYLEPSTAMRLEFRISEVTDQDTTLLTTPSVIVFPGDSANVSQKKAHSDELKITVTPTLSN